MSPLQPLHDWQQLLDWLDMPTVHLQWLPYLLRGHLHLLAPSAHAHPLAGCYPAACSCRPSNLVPAAVQGGELKDLRLLEERVESLQQELGTGHPQVGKAWMLLSRLYQVQSVCPAKAQYSLQRAWQVRNACAARMRLPPGVQVSTPVPQMLVLGVLLLGFRGQARAKAPRGPSGHR
jgi:hypothetical protein